MQIYYTNHAQNWSAWYLIHPLFWGVLGVWVTFKKAEMEKTLRNGLSMSETDPLNYKRLDFPI